MTVDELLGKLSSLRDLCKACKRRNSPPEMMDDIIETMGEVSEALSIAYRGSY